MSKLATTLATFAGLALGYGAFRYLSEKQANKPAPVADKPKGETAKLVAQSPKPHARDSPSSTKKPSRSSSSEAKKPSVTTSPTPSEIFAAVVAGGGVPLGMSSSVIMAGLISKMTVSVTQPLPEPTHPLLGLRLNHSTTDKTLTVNESADELLAQARNFDKSISMDELTGARLAASEHYRGTFTELCCIVDAELNRAELKRKSLFKHLTYRDTFGKQSKHRKAATRRDPSVRHMLAARAVLSGQVRGISRGAIQFFDPVAQRAANRKWSSGKSKRRHCPPLVILEKWCFGYEWGADRKRCELNHSKKGRRLQWVGPIPGVDPLRLMLFRRATKEHRERYAAARKLIKNHLGS